MTLRQIVASSLILAILAVPTVGAEARRSTSRTGVLVDSGRALTVAEQQKYEARSQRTDTDIQTQEAGDTGIKDVVAGVAGVAAIILFIVIVISLGSA